MLFMLWKCYQNIMLTLEKLAVLMESLMKPIQIGSIICLRLESLPIKYQGAQVGTSEN